MEGFYFFGGLIFLFLVAIGLITFGATTLYKLFIN